MFEREDTLEYAADIAVHDHAQALQKARGFIARDRLGSVYGSRFIVGVVDSPLRAAAGAAQNLCAENNAALDPEKT